MTEKTITKCADCGDALPEGYTVPICPKCALMGVMGGARSLEDSGEPVADLLTRLQSDFRLHADFDSRYEVRSLFDKGGQGELFEVFDRRIRRTIAMKRIRSEAVKEDAKIFRFLEEAQIAGQLNHPGIVPVIDLGFDGEGWLYYTMPYVQGRSLRSVVKEESGDASGRQRLIEVLSRVSETIAFAHDHSVVHRDLKPENILVGEFGEVYVIDWGAARAFGKREVKHEQMLAEAPSEELFTARHDSDDIELSLSTQNFGRPGTMIYMAPELFTAGPAASEFSADVYAIGVMLYEACVGRLPYSDSEGRLPGQESLRRRIVEESPLSPEKCDKSVPAVLNAIVERSMQRDPIRRYSNVKELAGDLRAYLESRVVSAYQTGTWPELKMWFRRNPWAYGGVAALIMTLGVIATTFVATRDARMRLANELYGNAQRAMNFGDWNNVIELLRQAEAKGYPDEVALELDRATTLLMQSKRRDAEDVLESLAQRSDAELGKHRSLVILRNAELKLFDLGEADEAVQKIQEALSLGLPLGEEDYAKGLLAESTEEASNFFDATLSILPRHHGARTHRLALNLFLGRFDRLEGDLEAFRALYPDDPTTFLAEAIAAGLHGRNDDLTKERLEGINPELRQVSEQALNLLALVGKTQSASYMFEATQQQQMLDGMALSGYLTTFSRYVDKGELGAVNNIAPGLVCFRKALWPGFRAIFHLTVAKNYEQAISGFASAVSRHPEGLFNFYYGMALKQQLESYDPEKEEQQAALLEIIRTFSEAVVNPSLFPDTSRRARYFLMIGLYDLHMTGYSPNEALRREWVGHLESVIRQPEVHFQEYQVAVYLARVLDAYEVGMNLIRKWVPGTDAEAVIKLKGRLGLEFAAKHYSQVLELLDSGNMASLDAVYDKDMRQMIQNSLAASNSTRDGVEREGGFEQ